MSSRLELMICSPYRSRQTHLKKSANSAIHGYASTKSSSLELLREFPLIWPSWYREALDSLRFVNVSNRVGIFTL